MLRETKEQTLSVRVTRLADWLLRIRARYEPMNGFTESAGLLHELLAKTESLEAEIAQYFGKQNGHNGFVAVAGEVGDGIEITADLGSKLCFLQVFGNVVDGDGSFGENLAFVTIDAVRAVEIAIFLCQIHPDHGGVDTQADGGAFGSFDFSFEINLKR